MVWLVIAYLCACALLLPCRRTLRRILRRFVIGEEGTSAAAPTKEVKAVYGHLSEFLQTRSVPSACHICRPPQAPYRITPCMSFTHLPWGLEWFVTVMKHI